MKKEANTQATKEVCLSALDEYINKVYVLVLLLVPGACQCAGLAYTFERVMGWLPGVSWTALIIFDITCLLYLAFGIFLIKTGFQDGLVRPDKLRLGKIFLVVIMFIQFNFILYMIPATDFWGFAFFFVILTSFFLDYKMVTVAAAEIAASVVASWILYGSVHLPLKNEFFMANLLDRIICVALSLPTVVLLTYLIGRFLVNAKKDEMERNNEKVQVVLGSVQQLAKDLSTAGNSLSQISENESASAEELAATSSQLLESSTLLGDKTEESLSNLDELHSWESVVAENVGKVEETSNQLLEKSQENEKLLSDLQSINADVSQSMNVTTEVAEKLSSAVQEIDVTLNLINDISTSTNLLALNASIEAARAGEAGRGFAVVAQEVGNLAKSTKDSLDEVKTVIQRVQDNVQEITLHVGDNSEKLTQQNGYFTNVFKGMQEMTQLLQTSVETIVTMGKAHEQQSEVIKNTVSINQAIARNIKNEIQQFESIDAMAEGNATDIEQITEQVTVINDMVNEVNELLKSV